MTEEAVKMLMQLNKEGFDTAVKRYELLRAISYVQPVGRRQLALYTGRTEREVRAECEALRAGGNGSRSYKRAAAGAGIGAEVRDNAGRHCKR